MKLCPLCGHPESWGHRCGGASTPPATESTDAFSPRYRAAVDTPLGVEFRDFYSKGHGVIVTERVLEKVAADLGFKPEECELVTITDNKTGDVLWPKAAV